jgi:hypothetical protein
MTFSGQALHTAHRIGCLAGGRAAPRRRRHRAALITCKHARALFTQARVVRE